MKVMVKSVSLYALMDSSFILCGLLLKSVTGQLQVGCQKCLQADVYLRSCYICELYSLKRVATGGKRPSRDHNRIWDLHSFTRFIHMSYQSWSQPFICHCCIYLPLTVGPWSCNHLADTCHEACLVIVGSAWYQHIHESELNAVYSASRCVGYANVRYCRSPKWS